MLKEDTPIKEEIESDWRGVLDVETIDLEETKQ